MDKSRVKMDKSGVKMALSPDRHHLHVYANVLIFTRYLILYVFIYAFLGNFAIEY